jgi:hypothetical protein
MPATPPVFRWAPPGPPYWLIYTLLRSLKLNELWKLTEELQVNFHRLLTGNILSGFGDLEIASLWITEESCLFQIRLRPTHPIIENLAPARRCLFSLRLGKFELIGKRVYGFPDLVLLAV